MFISAPPAPFISLFRLLVHAGGAFKAGFPELLKEFAELLKVFRPPAVPTRTSNSLKITRCPLEGTEPCKCELVMETSMFSVSLLDLFRNLTVTELPFIWRGEILFPCALFPTGQHFSRADLGADGGMNAEGILFLAVWVL